MTPFQLLVSRSASLSIDRQTGCLARKHGLGFAIRWRDDLADWLELTASAGAVIGTRHPSRPGYRTFPYRRQAIILAEYDGGTLRVARIYVAGQGWLG